MHLQNVSSAALSLLVDILLPKLICNNCLTFRVRYFIFFKDLGVCTWVTLATGCLCFQSLFRRQQIMRHVRTYNRIWRTSKGDDETIKILSQKNLRRILNFLNNEAKIVQQLSTNHWTNTDTTPNTLSYRNLFILEVQVRQTSVID